MFEQVDIELITNYMYLLGSGHVEYLLTKYRNLYQFNQQGWESLNIKITMIFSIILEKKMVKSLIGFARFRKISR